MKSIKRYFFICSITLFTSCAPSPENVSSIYYDGNNYFVWGFWNGISCAFSVVGKVIFGFDIGIYDASKSNSLSYWVGYILALVIYIRVIYFLLNIFWQSKIK